MVNEPFDVIVMNNKYATDVQYVGRPSALGNPFAMRSDESKRDFVCNAYDMWFRERVKAKDPEIMAALNRLIEIGKRDGVLRLGCYCAPKRCHADTIAAWIEQNQ